MQLNELDKAFFGQVREAARISRMHSKRQLVGQLLESNRIISADAKQIFELGEKVKRYEKALNEVIASEEEQAIRSYGLGDIAREALLHNDRTELPPPDTTVASEKNVQ